MGPKRPPPMEDPPSPPLPEEEDTHYSEVAEEEESEEEKQEEEREGERAKKKLKGLLDCWWGDQIMENVTMKALEVLDGPKREEMEKRLRKLHVEELELFLKRNELEADVVRALLDSYTKTD